MTASSVDSDKYQFRNWNNNTSITTNPITVTVNSDLSYTAYFDNRSYTITYNMVGGTAITQTTYTYGTAKSLPGANDAHRSHCTFVGWYDSYNSSTYDYGAQTNVTAVRNGTATGNKTFYAKWQGKSGTVTYHVPVFDDTPGKNTPDGYSIATPQSQTVSYNPYPTSQNPEYNDVTLTVPTVPVGSVYEFYGWYIDNDYNNQPITSVGQNQDYANINVYLRVYTVSLTFTPDIGRYATGNYPPTTPVMVRPNTSYTRYIWSQGDTSQPESEVGEFQGWSFTDDGTQEVVQPGEQLTVPASDIKGTLGTTGNVANLNIPVFAVWVKIYVLKVTYNVNSGYWGTMTTDTATRIYKDTSPTANRVVDLFADFVDKGYVDPQHADDVGPINFLGWDQTSTTANPQFENTGNEGKVILGARESGFPADVPVLTYPVDGSRVINLSLYAIWTSQQALIFYGNRGVSAGVFIIAGDVLAGVDEYETATRSNGKIPQDEFPTAVLNNYLFSGWFDAATGGNQKTYEDYFEHDTDPTELYAHWVTKHYITFSGPPAVPLSETMMETNSSEQLDKFPKVNTQKCFITGWFRENGTQVYLSSDTQHTPTTFEDDETLYAKWVASYKVGFDANGGQTNVSYKQTNATYQLDSYPIATYDGYTLDTNNGTNTGWYYKDNQGVPTTINTMYQRDRVLIAKWKPVMFTITFNPNEGTLPVEDSTWEGVIFGQTFGYRPNQTPRTDFPTPTPPTTQDGKNYTFMGWSYTQYTKGAEDAEADVVASQIFDKADTATYSDGEGFLTLYAVWTLGGNIITFDAMGGSVEPRRSVTTKEGLLTYYPLAYRTGYQFLGWYNWPVYYSNELIIQDNFTQQQIWNAYAVASGKSVSSVDDKNKTVEFTVLVNVNGSVVTQFQCVSAEIDVGGETLTRQWVDATDKIFTTYYTNISNNSYDISITVTGLSASGLQTALTNAWKTATKSTGTPAMFTTLVNKYSDTEPNNHMYAWEPYENTYKWTDKGIYTSSSDRYDLAPASGQSPRLNLIWANTQNYGGWTVTNEIPTPPSYTKNGEPFDSIQELIDYPKIPGNNDIAKVVQQSTAYYFKFTMPYGVTIVILMDDATLDKAYSWTKDDTVTVKKGKWVDTTNDEETVILPNKIFSSSATLYAHWTEMPFPSTLSNTCYIERRLNKDTADTIRLYMPPVKSITDTMSTSLVQKDTLMFGYENKFLSDLGNSRRLSVSFERPNPMPYDDMSEDSTKWSNGKWYKALLSFTNYWQNMGRDPVTGSLVGGFRFHFIPVGQSDEDDRVRFSDEYPVLNKNVFLVGGVEADFSPASLRFTMNLAVGAMTSDANSSGYQVVLTSTQIFEGDVSYSSYTVYTPNGIDLRVPEKPTEWPTPEGYAFSYWVGSDGKSYYPGDSVAYTVVHTFVVAGQVFTLDAVWVQTDACVMITRDGPHSLGSALSSIATISYDGETKKTTMTFLTGATIDALLIGGGGGGAGGDSVTEEYKATDNDLFNKIIQTGIKIYTGDFFLGEDMFAGGAGGSGEAVTKAIRVSAGDKLVCEVGEGGDTRYIHDLTEDYFHWHHYMEGRNGGDTTVTHLFQDVSVPKYYTAGGGYGGQMSGTGGQMHYAGGTGGSRYADQTSGCRPVTGPQGIPGEKGENYDAHGKLNLSTKTFWYGGGGGGATALHHTFKVGSSYLGDGANVTEDSKPVYVSIGANGASKGNNASDNAIYGGGGGGGCGGYTASLGGIDEIADQSVLPFAVTNCMNPSSGADGVIFLQLSRRD